jgi:F0F1-type ATP synthase membrane subunit c/vacuolar-type H+-ATPase subunit K
MEQIDYHTLLDAIHRNEELLVRVYASVEKTRRYFLWTLIITILAVVVPIIGLAFAIPFYFQTVVSQYQGVLGL